MNLNRFAVIDIGSNSIRSMLVRPISARHYRILFQERESIRLAGLPSDKVQQAVGALLRMKRTATSKGAQKFIVIATSAVREARKREEFIQRVHREVGLRIRVLSGREEARLAFESAAATFRMNGSSSAVLDVGGGSVELVLANRGRIRKIVSLPLGTVTSTRRFFRSDPPRDKDIEKLSNEIRRSVTKRLGKFVSPKFCIISGGTANSMVKVAGSRNQELSPDEVERVLAKLSRCGLERRRKLLAPASDRADIIVAGVSTILQIVRHLKVRRIRICPNGLRHALIRRIIAKKRNYSPK
jgi:exopolyphosphatase / guanosine-5'-triphosphate,3'-diphosphate pyrophosphatase